MLVRAKVCIVLGGKDYLPPALVELDDVEALAFIRLGFAERVEVVAPAAPAAPVAPPASKPTPPAKAPEPAPVPAPAATAEHHADLAEAFELLGEGDFETTGERAGRPKVSAVVDIVGHELSAEQIDAAFAAHQAANG